MPTCPNCGEIVMQGDPYCSHCGTAFRWREDEDDYFDDYVSALKLKTRHLTEDEEYRSALETVKELREYDDANNELKALRNHYIELYVRYAKDLEYGDANNAVNEYLEIFPDDLTFLKIISVKAREYRDLDLVNEINYRLDSIDGFKADTDFSPY